jgi:cellobiose dehydrogenase (acceptor)
MGTDNSSSVVDTNTLVYGTDNLFVVDASIFPGMVSNNPSALIVAVAEHAATKILALPVSTSDLGDNALAVNGTTSTTNSTVATTNGTAAVSSFVSTGISTGISMGTSTASAHPFTFHWGHGKGGHRRF